MIEVNLRRTLATGLLSVFALTAGCGEEDALPGTHDGSKPSDAGSTPPRTTTPTNGEEAGAEKPSTTFLVPEGEGDVEVTQVYSGDTHQVADARATLRATSDVIDVYVQDEFWESRVRGVQLDAFMHRLLDRGAVGSYRPELAVLATNEAVFGPLRTDGLPNGKQRIFVVNTSGAGDGYLCAWCDYPDLHLDGALVGPLDEDLVVSITAHELFHGIHRGYDADEEVWLDETLAEAAMSVNGLFTDEEWLGGYVRDPNIAWGPHGTNVASVHYGACLAWGTYLWEQGGPKLMRALTSEPSNGWPSIEASLLQVGETRTAWQLFLEMSAALYYDQPERGLGFVSFDLPRPVATRALTSGDAQTLELAPFGVVHLISSGGGRLTLEADDLTNVRVGVAADLPVLELELEDPARPIDVEPGLVVVSATKAATLRVRFD